VPPNALFDELLRAARELLAVRSPLDAELMVSELLGTWWGERGENARGADVERLVGEGLVDYAARRSSPAALALLSGIACLGTPRQASKAEQAALELMERGVRSPNWAQHLGAVTGSDCYVNSDAYGDTDEVVCIFSYGGTEPHALVTVVDYNADGMIRDGWVTSQVTKLLELCRKPDGEGDRNGFKPLDAPVARRMLGAALAETDAAANPPVSESFPSYHAFIRARVRALPPSAGSGRPAGLVGPAGQVGPGGSTGKRRPWSKDRRAMLAAEFLASDEAEDLSDRSSASHCADRIIDYGCDRDFGRPLRMSPVKVETFLLNWLPRKVMLLPEEQEAMPHVLLAWVRWAGRRRGLDEKTVSGTLDAVFNAMGPFGRAYRDPAEFGLDSALVARLLPDRDLEALPRRAFAFPLLHGRVGGVDLASLDPADPDGRRALLAAAHEDTGTGEDTGTRERHLERHLQLADRLWRGDPPALWEAAQRLLDADQDRHEVLHVLMDVIEAAGGDRVALAATLRDLTPESGD